MNESEFKRRTKTFAINVGKFCKTLPYDPITNIYIKQLIRCSSSVGANYRAACRGKSKADFINKMRIVEEEADESMYFLELIYDFHSDRKDEIVALHTEANEILSMIVKSINTSIKTLPANLKSQI